MYLPLTYPQYAASLFAANDLCRSALAAGSIIFAYPLYVNLGIGRGVSILGGLMVGGVIGIWLLYFFGAKLRAKSRFAISWVDICWRSPGSEHIGESPGQASASQRRLRIWSCNNKFVDKGRLLSSCYGILVQRQVPLQGQCIWSFMEPVVRFAFLVVRKYRQLWL